MWHRYNYSRNRFYQVGWSGFVQVLSFWVIHGDTQYLVLQGQWLITGLSSHDHHVPHLINGHFRNRLIGGTYHMF